MNTFIKLATTVTNPALSIESPVEIRMVITSQLHGLKRRKFLAQKRKLTYVNSDRS